MRLELTGRHLRITPPLRRLVEDGLGKLDRLLHDSAVSLQVVLYVEKYRHRVEATLHARGENFLHGTGSGRDWETALNQALGKINQQARKVKGKWQERRRRGPSAAKSVPPASRDTCGASDRRSASRASADILAVPCRAEWDRACPRSASGRRRSARRHPG